MNRFALGILLLGACDCGSSHTVDASDVSFVDAPTSGICADVERPREPLSTRVTGCASDGECTDGDQGRCVRHTSGTAYHCTYDECDADADCEEGLRCGCAVGPLMQDRCLFDECGSDCRPADCAPSFDCEGPGGMDPAYSVRTFQCHTTDDECRTSADCPASEFCTRGPFAGGRVFDHWECRAVSCGA